MLTVPARAFARKEVVPIAEHIHRHDDLVPESILAAMRELGYFGMAVPEEYGGQGMGNLPMIVITEELSTASLASAGSLITRPEILTKALVKGGTEAQHKRWLPPVARRVGQLSRGARGAGRHARLVHLGRQGVVHVRRARQRAGAAGPHQSGPVA